MKKQRIFITGMGAYTAYGQGVDSLWQGLLNKQSAVASVPEQWVGKHIYRSQVYVPLPSINLYKSIFSAHDLLRYDPVALIAKVSTAEALQQAQLLTPENVFNQLNSVERTGVFIGTSMGGITSAIAHAHYHLKNKPDLEELEHHPSYSSRLIIPRYVANASAAAIAILYGLYGPVKTNCQSCAAGTMAVGEAYRAIQQGHIDIAIAGGTEMLGDQFGVCFHAFDRLNMLTPADHFIEQSCKPFDVQRNGFLLSEGGSAICILESEASLRRRQQAGFPVKVLAEIVGYAESFDSYHMVMPDPQGKGIERLLTALLENAQLLSNDIAYINGHGTGTQQNDLVESQMLEKYFGQGPIINSTKGWIGHALGAAGAIELVVTAQSLLDKKVHANANLKNPIADLIFPTETTALKGCYALTQNFSLGGHNAGFILKAYDE